MTSPIPTPAVLAKHRASAGNKSTLEQRHHRGEIWMVVADPAAPAVGAEIWSNRPALVVSNNVLNGRSGFAQVVYITTSARKRTGPTHVEIPAPDSHGTAMALCEQVHTVDASRLLRKMSVLSNDDMHTIDAALALSLSIGRNPNTYGVFRKWEEYLKLHGIDVGAEITALAGQTTDQRVEALQRALLIVTAERDAYRSLYESSPVRESLLDDVTRALGVQIAA